MIKQQAKLSAIEQSDRTRLEKIVRDHIVEGLGDLAKIEATVLWRKTHKTFDVYCFDRLEFSRNQLDIETLLKRFYDAA